MLTGTKCFYLGGGRERRVAGAVLLYGVVNICIAGGPSTNGVAARAQAMQNAFSAIADDGSAVYYNPAGLTQIGAPQLTVGSAIMFPRISYTHSETDARAHSSKNALAYSLFFAAPVSHSTTFGIGIYAPQGRETVFTGNPSFGDPIHRAKILRLDVAPTIATRIANLSVGLGAVASYAEVDTEVFGFSEKGRGHGMSFQVAALYTGIDRARVAVVYRERLTAALSGSGRLPGIGVADFRADLKFPAVATIGISFLANERHRLTLAGEIQREFWGTAQEFVRRYNQPPFDSLGRTSLNARHSTTYRAGAEINIGSRAKGRAGLSHIQAAIPTSSVIPAQPDFSIKAISIGFAHQLGPKWRLDFGAEHQRMNERTKSSLPFPGEYRMHMNTLFVGAERAL